ncbi:hypothetical protein ACFWJ4_17195 [Kitasatospora sp. NPDC127067]
MRSSAVEMAEALFERFPGEWVVHRPGQVFALPGTTVTLSVAELVG